MKISTEINSTALRFGEEKVLAAAARRLADMVEAR